MLPSVTLIQCSAATAHPLPQNVPSVPTKLHRIDILGVDFLHPTVTQFPETTTDFPHDSIQQAPSHIPLNPLFSANPPNTFSQHPNQDPCYSHGPSGVRLSFDNVATTEHSPVTTTTAAFRILPAPSTQTSHQHCERSPFKLPDIQLDRFDGNPMVWPDWFAMFQSAIDDNKRLSESVKIYLYSNFSF